MDKKSKFGRYIGLFYIIIAVIGISVLALNHGTIGLAHINQQQLSLKQPYVQSPDATIAGTEQAKQGSESQIASKEQDMKDTLSKQEAAIASESKSADIETSKSENVTDNAMSETAEDADNHIEDETEEAVETEEPHVEITTQAGKNYSVTISGASFVNVRRSNITKAKTVGVLKEGQTGVLLEAGQYCSLIEVNGIKGYVYNKYLTIKEK